MSTASSRILGIHLSEGVYPRHLFAYFFVALVSSGFAGMLAVLEPGLWQIMGIPQEEQGFYTGNLRVLQEVYYILFMGLFGALSDRHGRRHYLWRGPGDHFTGHFSLPLFGNHQ